MLVFSNKSAKRRIMEAQIRPIKGAAKVDIERLRGLISGGGGDIILGNIDVAEVINGLLNSGAGFDDEEGGFGFTVACWR